MMPAKDPLPKEQKTALFKWNWVLLAVIILLTVINIYFIFKIIPSIAHNELKQLEDAEYTMEVNKNGNIGRWASANLVLHTIYEHRKATNVTIDDLKYALEQPARDEEGFFLYSFYDLTLDASASTLYPDSENLHIWSNALCAPGTTEAYIEIEAGDSYSETILQLGGAKDFAIVYGAYGADGTKGKDLIKCLDTESGFDQSDFMITDVAPTTQKGEENA